MPTYNKTGYKIDINGYPVHRKVSEMVDGKIKPNWHVHHCDFNKDNNNIENLIQIPKEMHEYLHSKKCLMVRPTKEYLLINVLPNFLKKESTKNKAEKEVIGLCEEIMIIIGNIKIKKDKDKIKKIATDIINRKF